MLAYFESLRRGLEEALSVAREARALGLDPREEVEIGIADELHERIAALFGSESIGERVRYWLGSTGSKVETAFRVIGEIVPRRGEESRLEIRMGARERAELALRVGMAIITDATVSAPIEGISRVELKGSGGESYLSVYYNGPIRTAGGTEGAMSVLMADYIRQRLGLGRYVPTREEVERYVEEVFLYRRIAHLQYNSEPEEVRRAVMNIPVEITGPPTEREEVSSLRNLARVETNRVRGGAVLVINDCILQKARKLRKMIDQIKGRIDDFDDSCWGWMEGGDEGKVELEPGGCPVVEPSYKYLKDAVMGRPVLSHPSRIGGFRLRYGRARNTGLASIGMNPATMYLLDSFIAVGTQVRMERPGKSAVVMPVDSIEGPTVRLRDGSLVRVDDPSRALELIDEVEEIVHLGDVLIAYGEFLENNHPLLPSAWTEEWWEGIVRRKGGEAKRPESFEEALRISRELGVPLHPRFTYYWEHLRVEDLMKLVKAVRNASYGRLRFESDLKRILELLGVPHRVEGSELVFDPEDWKLLSYVAERLPDSVGDENSSYATLKLLNDFLEVKIMPKGPTKVGMRVGRPEKAKSRKMKPPVNLLFPVGNLKGSSRSLEAAYERGTVSVEVALRLCRSCGMRTTLFRCPNCGSPTSRLLFCPVCGRQVNGRCQDHPAAEPVQYRSVKLNIREEVDRAIRKLGESPELLSKVKGVKGLTSGSKIPEPIEKGILRAKHGLHVFKDGTVRFDAVNAVLTHFRPEEVGVSPERLRELGYDRDINGEELRRGDQMLELKVQDVIIPRAAAKYLVSVAKYVDELLVKFYGLKPFYNVEREEDLVGKLILTISPHTFVANLARVVGFTNADVLFAHPFLHAAKRRNVDGDEDSIMLLLDALINFSKEFLPSTPGGREDAPLLLVSRVDPKYIDDEVYNMEVVGELPPEFYEATYRFEDPSNLRGIVETVGRRIESGDIYPRIMSSVGTSRIDDGPLQTTYRRLDKMSDKMEAHFSLERKIRAVDAMDALARVITSHFIRDIVGNLRGFGQQVFRCTECNAKYRRPPISGRCLRCGGNITLTVHRGTVMKYLRPTLEVMRRYGVEGYLLQRVRLIESEISSLFRERRGSNGADLSSFLVESEGRGKRATRLVDFL
ncbi:MAG: DNA polymerase II large subunit [Candidatus Korarchaeota archaeon NZ13-K]|nr:MAG: DNA polymerase II large subunit [Candidatus Korarchaeota archaeon NZ13-K]